jgi:hypothetical protein
MARPRTMPSRHFRRLRQINTDPASELTGVIRLCLWNPDFAYLEQVFVRSNAALRVARYLGGRESGVGGVSSRTSSDFLMTVRQRTVPLVWKDDTCLLPSPEVRNRFLD